MDGACQPLGDAVVKFAVEGEVDDDSGDGGGHVRSIMVDGRSGKEEGRIERQGDLRSVLWCAVGRPSHNADREESIGLVE